MTILRHTSESCPHSPSRRVNALMSRPRLCVGASRLLLLPQAEYGTGPVGDDAEPRGARDLDDILHHCSAQRLRRGGGRLDVADPRIGHPGRRRVGDRILHHSAAPVPSPTLIIVWSSPLTSMSSSFQSNTDLRKSWLGRCRSTSA